jgi:hypothetical protein
LIFEILALNHALSLPAAIDKFRSATYLNILFAISCAKSLPYCPGDPLFAEVRKYLNLPKTKKRDLITVTVGY